MELILHSLNELPKAVLALLSFAQDKKKLLFTGEIGAGKTTFIQTFCQHFEVKEYVTSPTFSLINEYSYLDENKQERLIHHVDLYRLNNIEEAIDIGIEDYLYDNDYCLIEWPGLIEPILPEEIVRISIKIQSDSSRKILFL